MNKKGSYTPLAVALRSLLTPCARCGVVKREHDSEILHPYEPKESR
jgi:hypothetical protein